jgi:hypothetical protein
MGYVLSADALKLENIIAETHYPYLLTIATSQVRFADFYADFAITTCIA